MTAPPRAPGTRSSTGGGTVGNRSAPARRAAGRRRTAARRPPAARRSPSRRSAPSGRRIPRRGRTGIRQWWPGLLVVAAVLIGVAWDSDSRGIPTAPGLCALPASTMLVTTEQAGNAAVIADVAHARGLPQRALVIALATAQQESGLRNLDYGDRDSLGLFQQRPSQGWGTAAQVQDPAYAAGKFFDHLMQVPGWHSRRLTDVAQTVQRSGFPEAYQKWEPMATALAKAVQPGSPRLTCH